MQREFKKLKSQINHIEEIAHNSKVGALIEQESSLRKKIRQLIDNIKMLEIDMKNY